MLQAKRVDIFLVRWSPFEFSTPSSLTLVFMSAFWMVYPVISELPSSVGGSHSSAALKPHTSVTLTFRGGPGFSALNSCSLHSSHSQSPEQPPMLAVQKPLPITLISMVALSSMFSICSTSSYLPECSLSAERMNRMLSTLELRTLTVLGSMGWPSLNQVATGRGLPFEKQKGIRTFCEFYIKKQTNPYLIINKALI